MLTVRPIREEMMQVSDPRSASHARQKYVENVLVDMRDVHEALRWVIFGNR